MKYGKTPWDNMTKDELLFEVWRLYQAAESARTCIKLHKIQTLTSSFWSNRGTGGNALNRLDEAMETVSKLSDKKKERLWHDFFRNALPLLFKSAKKGYWNWLVCEKCNCWTSGIEPVEKCILCGNKDLRPIRWSDFRK